MVEPISSRVASGVQRWRVGARALRRFPWRITAHTLRERFREDRLGLTAGSLTLTTAIALVPLLTVALALFTAFPMFAKLQGALQQWLVDSLIPDTIARQVLAHLTQFAAKAKRLGGVGLGALLVTALALMLTIDRTLNAIWRVRQPRPLGQRVLVYWALVTLGPLVLALVARASLGALTASFGAPDAPMAALMLDALQALVLAAALAALYHYVPNAPVRWGHAWAGAIAATVGLDLAKRLLVVYLAQVPTYSLLYGALATVPILLVWMYLGWVIVLLGAVVAAYLPSLLAGVHRRVDGAGGGFALALEALAVLDAERAAGRAGLSLLALARRLRVDDLQLEPVLQTLQTLDWVGLLQDADETEARWVLLVDPSTTPVAALAHRLLLACAPATEKLWDKALLRTICLREVLPKM